MLIDARVRLPFECRKPTVGGTPARLLEQYDRVLDLSAKSENGTRHRLLTDLADAGVSQAVLHAEYEGGFDAEQLNDATAEMVEAHRDVFVGVGTLTMPPERPTVAARQVDAIHRMGLVGVNVQPAFFGLSIDDRRLYPSYARAEELGLVVAIHTGINYSRMHPMRHERPELLDQVACDFPDLQLVACHAGWPWAAELCAVARRHPTVHLEFGGLAPKYIDRPGTGWDVVRSYLPSLLAGQVLFASDWPVMPIQRVVREWSDIDLPATVAAALMGENARRLFWKD